MWILGGFHGVGMKHLSIGLFILAGILSTSFADIHYVSTNSLNPTSPYTNWETAAVIIQDAINVSEVGDTISVTNGVYQAIVVDMAIALRSVNGPDVTIIPGLTTNGSGSTCAMLSDGSSLDGFTLRDGGGDAGGALCTSTNVILTNCIIVGNSGNTAGGVCGGTLHNCTISGNTSPNYAGVGGSYNSVLYHCVLVGNSGGSGGGAAGCELHFCEITGNSSYYWGGGTCWSTAYNCMYRSNSVSKLGGAAGYGSLYNCLLTGNVAGEGGGGTYCVDLYNCTVIGNTGGVLGGMYSGNACNSIIYYNYPQDHQAWCDDLHNCCTPGSWNVGGAYFTNAPGIVSLDNPRLLASSPCVNAGSNGDWIAGSLDLDGKPRTNGPVDIGAYEYWSDTKTGVISAVVSASNSPAAPGIVMGFSAVLSGQVDNCVWDFGGGVTVTGVFETSHSFLATGTHEVVITAWNLDGSVTGSVSVRVVGTDIYVSPDGDDGHDGAAWTNAKATIQAAIDDAWEGATRVLVSNGVYDTGGRVGSELPTNRVLLDKPLVLESVNGPDVTFIIGQPSTNTGGYGYDAIRCLGATTGSLISGFTFRDGYTTTNVIMSCPWDPYYCWISDVSPASGGGIWSPSPLLLVVSNCVFRNNHAYVNAGGAGNVGLVDCIFIDNSADTGDGGGANNCSASNCEFIGNQAVNGGGMSAGFAVNCAFESNAVTQNGGGIHNASAENCVFVGNTATAGGGATAGSDVSDCLLVCNTAQNGGGAYGGSVHRCLITSNAASGGGGACLASLDRCTVMKNDAGYGGGILDGSADSCLICDNVASSSAAGAIYAHLYNCTIVRNRCTGEDGGVYACQGFNNIIVSNEPCNMRWIYGMTYVCSSPYYEAEGWVTNDPCFVDYNGDDFHLASNSPCIDAGTTNDEAMDLDGIPRPLDGNGDGAAVCDLGCYEFVHPTADTDGDGLSDTNEIYVWHTQALAEDSDGDRTMDGDEVTAGTDPLSSGSFLGLDSVNPAGSGWLLTWRTVFGKGYWVQRSTDLASGVWSNLWNYPISELDEYPEGTESFYDLNAPTDRPAVYRVQLNE